ncbi:NAD(P)/FAD-dependent oxidoreductase [Fluviibacterium sp. S390]|uniref:NAD(P)/FAD-dependent oxidoreductase n=1 Tax=Fluviibacterium sp. S390 TaxID=3415139 RepID=UPI003C7ED5AF
MPYDRLPHAAKRIAVIGGGISGMGAAHALARDHLVTLIEAEPRLGGHARTVLAGKRGDQPVDTGFIVFNHATYPNLRALFDELDVPTAEAQMTFATSVDGGRFEYALNSLDSVFGQRRNIADPRYWGFLRDIARFNAKAEALVEDEKMTIAGLLDKLGTGAWFRDYYILPFSGAIWSTPTHGILEFPAAALVRFFRNHALLSATGQHQWYTVRGGSVEYVRRLHASMTARGVDIRTGTKVTGVTRTPFGVQVATEGQGWEDFDEVVLATHSDISLKLLQDADPQEQAALSAIRYQPNTAVLHSDASLMPRRKRCWAAWNYTEAAGARPDRISLSYWMNALQPIPKDDPLFVTLNPVRDIRDETIHDTTTFHHPVYDVGALAAQQVLKARNGQNRTWFCGAWMRNGFHEDGLASALDVVAGLQTPLQIAAE